MLHLARRTPLLSSTQQTTLANDRDILPAQKVAFFQPEHYLVDWRQTQDHRTNLLRESFEGAKQAETEAQNESGETRKTHFMEETDALHEHV